MRYLFFIVLLLCSSAQAANNLIDIFQQAMANDPTYQQAIAQSFSNQEDFYMSVSSLLPNLVLDIKPKIDKAHNTGGLAGSGLLATNNSTNSINVDLKLKQPIFDLSKFLHVSISNSTSKQAVAVLNAAFQDMIVRVTQAYFNVLRDEDILTYSRANKNVLKRQLDQAKQLFKAGSKTAAEVSAADSAYGTAASRYVADETQLAVDKAFLSTLTASSTVALATLGEDFPLASPQPANVDDWSSKSQQQNWNVKSKEYALEAARQTIKQQMAGNLPSLEFEGHYTTNTSKSLADSILYNSRSTYTKDTTFQLNLNVPIFSGGSVLSQTRKAKYDYQVAQQQLEFSQRNAAYNARQSYLIIQSDIKQIGFDKVAIASANISLKNLEERYKIGAATLLEILTQQEKVFQAQQQYATDRYSYINNLLLLKNAAGSLGVDDLRVINAWLVG